MPNIVAVDQQSKGNIKELGQLIRDCRGTLSQSKLAKKVGLPRSNMKYIEDGVNAPTAEVYEKLIDTLKPDPETHAKMDALYMAIRRIPPPDAMRKMGDRDLTLEQVKSVDALFASFQESREGEVRK